MAATAVDDRGASGNAHIDSLLRGEWHWSGTITYFFDNDVSFWSTAERNAYRGALATWSAVANIPTQEVFVESQANFIEHSVPDSTFGADPPLADHEAPDEEFSNQVDGRFNYQRYSLQTTGGMPAYNETGLVRGGYGYETFVHELGHALGLAHPHDDGGGSRLFPGIEDDDDADEDLGDNDLNQVIYTVMSYNEFDQVAGDSSYGYAAGPMAFDIAAIQYLYGANMNAGIGNTTYVLPDSNAAGTFFTSIWDVNGIDEIVYNGARNTTIDLRPATLRNEAGGGGFISRADGIHGGFTIAGDFTNRLPDFGSTTGVIIENARGGSGNDTIRGNDANNHLEGRDGRDVLEGFGGGDVLDQGLGGGELYGGDGNDELWASDGTDYIDGGNGSDIVVYARSNAPIQIDTTIGKVVGGWATGDTLVSIESVIGSAYDDIIQMGDEDNHIWGGNGGDRLDGRGGVDFLFGQDGDDILRGGAGGDGVHGGAGFDIAAFESAVTINLATNVHGGEAAGDAFFEIEQFNGSAQSDTMVASNAAGARFAGGDGVDYLYGGDRDDWLQGGRGADYINGGNGYDMVSYADAPNGITVEMYLNDGTTDGKITAGEWGLDTLVSIEDVEGTAFGDYMIGDERGNRFLGLGGDDYLQGDQDSGPQGSADILIGGAGNDRILIGANDFADGGADFDSASFVGGPIYLNFNSNTFTVGGQGFYLTGFESYAGTGGGDTVYGASYGETINLGAGNDYLYGQGGDDFLYTGAGADVMDGGTGFDTVVFDHAMVADWQAGVLDADIGSDAWYSWEAIQGSSGDDRIRTNSWGYAVTLRGGAGNDVLATGETGVIADRLFGEVGNDVLDGGAGDDYLEGGAGDDTLNGRTGIDTASFTGSYSDYRVTLLDTGELQVADQRTDAPQGTDTLYSVENIAFGDRTIAPVAQLEDVVWRHVDGTVATAGFNFGGVATTWQTQGFGDFDGDGDGDVLWRHQDGAVVTWEMHRGQIGATHTVAFASTGWEIVNTGDFDADGDADVLWRHRDGAVVTWEMENGSYVQNHNIAFASVGWTIQGLGDFDGDGDSDVIWRHRDGAVVTWEMENGEYVVNHNIAFASTGWEIQGTGDLDADGDDDILWRHRDGAVVSWEMENGEYVQNHNIAFASTNWRIAGTVDANDDGADEILWQHQDGMIATWEMDGGEFVAAHTFGAVSNEWRIQGTGQFEFA